MISFEKILDVFNDDLLNAIGEEVLKTKHGYIALSWDEAQNDYAFGENCKTPEALLDTLLMSYESYLQLQFTKGLRDLTNEEVLILQEKRNALYEKCMTA